MENEMRVDTIAVFVQSHTGQAMVKYFSAKISSVKTKLEVRSVCAIKNSAYD